MFFAEVSRVEQRVPRDNNAPITCCGNLVTISRKVTEKDSKTALEFDNCKKQLFTRTMCLPARL